MIVYRLKLCSGASVKDGNPFRTAHLLALAVEVVGCGVGVDGEVVAASVNGAAAGLHHELAIAVAIKVPCYELRGVGGVELVGAGVDYPQPCSIELVAGIEGRRGNAAAGGVLAVGGGPLQDYLVFPVTVHVAVGGIIGRIGGSGAGRVGGSTTLQVYILCLFRPRLLAHLRLKEFAVLVIYFQAVVAVLCAVGISEVCLALDEFPAVKGCGLSSC